MKYAAFVHVTVAAGGIFLVVDTGVSIFVPRSAFETEEGFRRVAETICREQ